MAKSAEQRKAFFISLSLSVSVQHKCIQYWPDEGEKRVNDFRIRLETEEKYADYTIRRFTLYNQAEVCSLFFVNDCHSRRIHFEKEFVFQSSTNL